MNMRGLLIILVLIGTTLACTATMSDDNNGSDSGEPVADNSSVNPGGAPGVRILSPANGDQVPAKQRLDITVETNAQTTSFLLNVNGRVTSSKAMPPEQTGAAKAILSWQPEREGTYTLEVVAFNGAAASSPASIQVIVSGTAASGAGSTPTNCTGRVMVSELNFRDAPGTAANKLGQFDVGETVTVIGRNNETTWYKVQRYNAQQAWVINNNQWFQIEGQCGTLPVTS